MEPNPDELTEAGQEFKAKRRILERPGWVPWLQLYLQTMSHSLWSPNIHSPISYIAIDFLAGHMAAQQKTTQIPDSLAASSGHMTEFGSMIEEQQ